MNTVEITLSEYQEYMELRSEVVILRGKLEDARWWEKHYRTRVESRNERIEWYQTQMEKLQARILRESAESEKWFQKYMSIITG